MRRPRRKLEVNTFPFLAVLLCAMGAFILLLMVIDRRAKIVSQNKARDAYLAQKLLAESQRDAAMKDHEAKAKAEWRAQKEKIGAELKAEEDALARQITDILAALSKTDASLDNQKQTANDLARKVSLEDAALKSLQKELGSRQDQLERARQASQGHLKLREQLTRDLAVLEAALRGVQERKARERPVYSLIPYKGKHGASAKPIYIEVSDNAISIHPGPTTLTAATWSAENLRRAVEERTGPLEKEVFRPGGPPPPKTENPYLLFLVRPSGIANYYEAQQALRGYRVDFGYELIEADWVFDFGNGKIDQQPWRHVAKIDIEPPNVTRPAPKGTSAFGGNTASGFGEGGFPDLPQVNPGSPAPLLPRAPGQGGGATAQGGSGGGGFGTSQPGFGQPGSAVGSRGGSRNGGGQASFPGSAPGSQGSAGPFPGGPGGPGVPGGGPNLGPSFPGGVPGTVAGLGNGQGTFPGGPAGVPGVGLGPNGPYPNGNPTGGQGVPGAVAGLGGPQGAFPGSIGGSSGQPGTGGASPNRYPGTGGSGNNPNGSPQGTFPGVGGESGGQPGSPGQYPGGYPGTSNPAGVPNNGQGVPGVAGGSQGTFPVTGGAPGSQYPNGSPGAANPGSTPNSGQGVPGTVAGLGGPQGTSPGSGGPYPNGSSGTFSPGGSPNGGQGFPGNGSVPNGQPGSYRGGEPGLATSNPGGNPNAAPGGQPGTFTGGPSGNNPSPTGPANGTSTPGTLANLTSPAPNGDNPLTFRNVNNPNANNPNPGSDGPLPPGVLPSRNPTQGDDGEPGPTLGHSPFLKGERPKSGPRLPALGRIIGNRDFVMTVECSENSVSLSPPGRTYDLSDPEAVAKLVAQIKTLVAGRQRTVRPGEPPYRPMLVFRVQPDGRRTYYSVYPRLADFGFPMVRDSAD